MREVVIETVGHDEWTSKIIGHEVNIRMVNCRPHGDRGMMQFVMINSGESIRKVLRAIRSHPNVIDTDMSLINDHRASGILVTKSSPLCRTLAEVSGFCSGCYFTQNRSDGGRWRILLGGDVSLDKFVRGMKKKGISCSISQVEKPRGNTLLTFEQEKAMKLAERQGYFAIPRMVGVRELAEMLGMAPSTLDEVLRRAERKVVESFMKDFKVAE